MLRVFLGASVLVWLPYGVYCFLEPAALAGIAGVGSESTTGSIEIRAMYGGLQIALGVFPAAALFRPSLARPYLLAIAFLCAGLFSARLLGAALASEFSAYTALGLLFEILWCGFALRLLASAPEPAPA